MSTQNNKKKTLLEEYTEYTGAVMAGAVIANIILRILYKGALILFIYYAIKYLLFR